MKRILLILMFISLSYGTQLEIFVSPDGNDLNSGTETNPLKTLTAAKTKIIDNTVADSLVITMLNGTYYTNSSFSFDSADLPLQNPSVIIRGKQGNSVAISGATLLTRSTSQRCDVNDITAGIRVSDTSNIIKWAFADVGLTGTNIWSLDSIKNGRVPQLYHDTDIVLIAQWPDIGYGTIDSVAATKPITVATGDGPIYGDSVGKIYVSHENAVAWHKEATHVFLHGYWFYNYWDNMEKISSIDTINNLVQTSSPYSALGYRKGQRFRAQNVLSQINQSGRWAVDPSRGYIYLWSPTNQDTFSLTTNINNLFSISEISKFTIENLALENSNSEAVHCYHCTTATISNCTIRGITGVGITFDHSKNCRITNNVIYNIGSTAIDIRSWNNRSPEPSNVIVANNIIHDYSYVCKTYKPGIWLSPFSAGCRLAYNTIYNSPHSAIIYYGNNHNIENNYIYNVCNETRDAGGIYTGRDWTARGALIRHNVLKNFVDSSDVNGIYLDDYSSGNTVTDNLIENIPCGIHSGEGSDNTITNNIFANNRIWWLDISKRILSSFYTKLSSRLSLLSLDDNALWTTYYPILKTLLDESPEKAKRDIIINNIVVNSGSCKYLAEVDTFGIIDSGTIASSYNMPTWLYGKQSTINDSVYEPIILRRMPIKPIVKKIYTSNNYLYVVCAPSYHDDSIKAKIENLTSRKIRTDNGDNIVNFTNMYSGNYKYDLWYNDIVLQDSTYSTSGTIPVSISSKMVYIKNIKMKIGFK